MIEIYFKDLPSEELARIPDFCEDCWIRAKEAKLEDLHLIAKVAGLNIEDLRDSLDKQEIPRIEYQGDNLFLFMRHPAEPESGLYTTTLVIIITQSYFITISPYRSEVVEHLLLLNPFTTHKAKCLQQILHKITQDYSNSIKRVRHAILEQEQSPRTVNSDAIVLLTRCEEVLNQYLIALVPMRNILEQMGSKRHPIPYEIDYELIHDFQNAIKQSEDLCHVNVKSIRSLRDSYQILFTNDVNRTIKLLTALTVIFMIPTIITSFYGMNVRIPFQDTPHAFAGILAISFIASISAVLFFVRKRWL